jgi:hypothetical protein
MSNAFHFDRDGEWYVVQTTSPFNSFMMFDDEIRWLEERYDNDVYHQRGIIFMGKNEAFVRLTCFDDPSFDAIVEFCFKSHAAAIEFHLTFA